MAIKFDFYANPQATETELSYHPRIVNKSPLETEEIIELISHRCSLTGGDVIACLTELKHILSEGLNDGRSVQLTGIGSFNLALGCTAPEVTPRTRAEHVKIKSITYRPAKELKQELATAKFERVEIKNHSALLTNQAVDQQVEAYLKEHTTVTRKELEALCHFTRSKALQQINRLLNEGKLVNLGSRYQAIYTRHPSAQK